MSELLYRLGTNMVRAKEGKLSLMPSINVLSERFQNPAQQ